MRSNQRTVIATLCLCLATALLTACNSNDAALSQTPKSATPNPTGTVARNPNDDARRITAQELYELYQKDKVLIVDTRTEPAYKESRIKGAILIPAADFPAKADELPRDKMIVAYCT